MPHDEKNSEAVIPVELIHETVMPPYEFQQPQHGFGSTSTDTAIESKSGSKKSLETKE